MAGRPAILLLHGFTNTHRCWDRVRDRLGGWEVLAPDIRGHGAANAQRPVDLASVLDDLSTLAPERFILAGYSQGGRIALHAALDPRFAGRIDRLVLISASPGIADPVERATRRRADERLAAEFETMSIAAIAERWSATPVLAGLSPELAAEAHADRLHGSAEGLAAALRGLGTGALASLWERLAELDVAVTLITGERDRKFCAIAEQMAARLRTAERVVVPGAGHQVHLEAPGDVARVLTRVDR